MSWFERLSDREIELLRRNLAKTNPPPILYRYRRQSEWAIKELTVPEVHVAGVQDMNDPFEYRAPISINVEKLRSSFLKYAQMQGMDEGVAIEEAKQAEQHAKELYSRYQAIRKASGLICCSSDPRSNRMWAYYADGHKGICIGYDTSYSPFCFARKVSYRNPERSLDFMDVMNQDPTLLSDHVSCRKGLEWEFEQEYRLPIGPIPDGHTRLLPLAKEAIIEVRLGVNITPEFRSKVFEAMKHHPHRPRIIQMACDHDSFSLRETIVPGG